MIYEITDLNERTFRALLGNALVRNGADYSRRFLGRSRTYHAMLKHQNRQPSPECWQHLAQQMGELVRRPMRDETRALLSNLLTEIASAYPAAVAAGEVMP